ncbi:MAG: hypothetical protein ACFFDF_09715 [Candidatus Odinarchaeota archaeon]
MDEKNHKDLVKYSFSFKNGNYIANIYYEFETNKAVLFGRNTDEKALWVPKSIIKGGWKKDKRMPQNIKIKYPIPLEWKESINSYLEIVG